MSCVRMWQRGGDIAVGLLVLVLMLLRLLSLLFLLPLEPRLLAPVPPAALQGGGPRRAQWGEETSTIRIHPMIEELMIKLNMHLTGQSRANCMFIMFMRENAQPSTSSGRRSSRWRAFAIGRHRAPSLFFIFHH